MFHSRVDLNPTHHALERWSERFPGEDMLTVFLRAGSLGDQGLRERVIAHLRGKARWTMSSKQFRGYYYLYDKRSGAVFVMTPPNVVVTVLKMPETTGPGDSNE